MNRYARITSMFFALFIVADARAGEQVLTADLHHLRAGDIPEWSEFPKHAEGPALKLSFQAKSNAGEWTLRLRQQDVKQPWKVLLNGKELGRLRLDENDTTIRPMNDGSSF